MRLTLSFPNPLDTISYMSTVLIADDHPLFRMGLSYALQQEGFSVVAEASNGLEVLEQVKHHAIDICLLDVKMPEQDGIATCTDLRTRGYQGLILMLTTFEEAAIVEAVRKAGANAYFSKETDAHILAKAIRNMQQSGDVSYFPETHLPDLSNRELEVLHYLSRGMSNKAIAKRLELSPETIKSYVGNVYNKLAVSDRVSAVRTAQEYGLLN